MGFWFEGCTHYFTNSSLLLYYMRCFVGIVILIFLVLCCDGWLMLIANRSSCFQLKREDILSNSIQTRSKAHQIIKRMLASLGDPYTRFLSPQEVIHSFNFHGHCSVGVYLFITRCLFMGTSNMAWILNWQRMIVLLCFMSWMDISAALQKVDSYEILIKLKKEIVMHSCIIILFSVVSFAYIWWYSI